MLSINALLFLPILNILLLKRVSWCVGLLTLVDWSHWLHHAITNRATKLKFFMQTQCLYFKSIWGHWGHLYDKSRNINFAFTWSGCIQSEIGSPAVTVYLLCLRLLWSFFFLDLGSNVNTFFPCASGFSARLSLQVRCQACAPFMAPSALHEMCLGSVGFFSLAFLFHLQPELLRTNYSCGVTSRSCCSICLRGQPQCVRVCVYHI